MLRNFKFENGIDVKSNITGFKGVVIARSEHLNGCDRYYVQPKVDKDGKYPDGIWMDEGEVIQISKKKIKPQNQDNGGFSSKIK